MYKRQRVGQLVAQEASRRLGKPFGIIDLSLAPTPAVGAVSYTHLDVYKRQGLYRIVNPTIGNTD